jgi:uncharacterized protein (DUF934 family)
MPLLRKRSDGRFELSEDPYEKRVELGEGTRLVPWSALANSKPEDLGGTLGVQIAGDAQLDALVPYLPKLSLVAIEFPAFTDGRGYSLARLLRERYAFRGELRAVGDVLRDQLLYMARCGFDALELADGRSVQSALAAFEEFSAFYQPAADHALPLWKRSARGS